ncbi:uncharacterized protein JCM15063_004574 [Sporobolomyces koalae]|uniref:uncharacterized protein n=1 Tax=Sporobolomyces koalae TaxID=500713 RepID=UPI00316D9BC7
MVPRARLTFTRIDDLTAVTETPFNVASIGSFTASPPASSTFNRTLAPEPELVGRRMLDVTGPFSLHAGGIVQVEHIRVKIDQGTHVARCCASEQSDSGSKGLWWTSTGLDRDELGVWELHLLRATDADVRAVHRLLLYLPPADVPVAQLSQHRHSLLLYDCDTRRVVSVTPLDPVPERATVNPSAASSSVDKPLPSPPSRPSSQPRAPLSPGARIAEYVDKVVQGIHPDPTDEALSAAERLERARRARDARREEQDWDPFHLGDILLAVPPVGSTSTEEADNSVSSTHGMSAYDEFSNDRAAQDAGSSTRAGTSSVFSLSSLATHGSASSDISGARNESSDMNIGVKHNQSVKVTDPVSSRDIARQAVPVESSSETAVRIVKRPEENDAFHTITRGNAVLLDFLADSIIEPLGSQPHPTRMAISAKPLSERHVRELTAAGAIKALETNRADSMQPTSLIEWLRNIIVPQQWNTRLELPQAVRSLFAWTALLWPNFETDQVQCG